MIVSPYSSACYNFKRAVNGEKEKVTVVIVPVKIENNGSTARISWACSMGHECAFLDCRYAHKKPE